MHVPGIDRCQCLLPSGTLIASLKLRTIQASTRILAINGGSSSIRFAVYEAKATLKRHINGKLDRLGASGTNLTVCDQSTKKIASYPLKRQERLDSVQYLLKWLEEQQFFGSIEAIGHRVVHGMEHSQPEPVTPKLLAELRRIKRYSPEHLPIEIRLIEEFRRRHPKLHQVACFDTAFHRSMPRVAKLLPIPRKCAAKGLVRYGFHGLSYTYLMEELGLVDRKAAQGRVVLAHLGNGASLAAVHAGQCIDTSMGFTPASGLVMSTRTGDIDPGIALYLSRTLRMSPVRMQHMVNHESGLLGVSGISSDMRDLVSKQATNKAAAEAVDLFCYQAKKWIGSFAAALGGLDTLVFTGGIGENAPTIRMQICSGLHFLGIELEPDRNSESTPVISSDKCPVAIRVIATDEELMIDRAVHQTLSP